MGKGNIEDEQTDAIVNSTGGNFDMSGAISTAIGRRAGSDWIERCRRVGCLKDVYVTEAPNLDCKKVIHVKAPADVRECRRLAIKVLLEAASSHLTSISFPMIGTGGGGLEPLEVAAVLAEVVALAAHKQQLRSIMKVRFVAYDDFMYELFLMNVKEAIQMASSLQLVEPLVLEPPRSHRDRDLPAKWVSMKKHELCLQIELKAGDPEFEKIRTLFMAEKAKPVTTAKFIQNCTLKSVFRVQNPTLYRQYTIAKEALRTKYIGKPEIVKNLERRKIFHGTTERNVSEINSAGFDRSFCGRNKTAFGKGVYFARDLSYSCDRAYSPPNSQRIKYVYIVKALLGVSTQGFEDMPHLPENPNGLPFDSAVDNPEDPTVFVLFRDHYTYPKYIMHITEDISHFRPTLL